MYYCNYVWSGGSCVKQFNALGIVDGGGDDGDGDVGLHGGVGED